MSAARKPLLESYLRDRENAATVDEFTQIIPRLPPPQPAAPITEQPAEIKTGPTHDAATYLLQLPPEYRTGRNWPVLIVLHQSGSMAADILKRWSEAAGENGYILVAPEWSQGLGGDYGYTDREHAVVLDTLRDLRRRFAVDSDRVFLFGLGQGGEMAFDVGLSHPDLFAGVLPMSAGPRMFATKVLYQRAVSAFLHRGRRPLRRGNQEEPSRSVCRLGQPVSDDVGPV